MKCVSGSSQTETFQPVNQYLGDDAAELRAVLCERQQVADGAADGVHAVRGVDLFDQELEEHQTVCQFLY